MIITKEILLARQAEVIKQRDQARATASACDGAHQILELLINTLDAPADPAKPTVNSTGSSESPSS